MSLPEVLLWQQLRLRPGGLKFRRQHAADPHVADFCCASARLVVEVDGIVHDMGEIPARDERRQARLRDRGLQVLRVPAADILKDAAEVANIIAAWAGNPLHQPPAGPPPRAGEDI